MHSARLAQPLDDPGDQRIGVVDQHAVIRARHAADTIQDVRLGPLGEALHVAQPPLLGRGPQRLDGVDPELHLQQAHRLRADTRDAQDLEQAVRYLGAEPVVVLEAAGL